MPSIKNQYVKYGLIVLLSLGLILFTQVIKLIKNPDSTPVIGMTLLGLGFLWLFSMVGIVIANLSKKVPIKIIQDFPVLGWVAITSLVFCLTSDLFVEAIRAVDFLSLTTPILTYAGISVANRLTDLRKTSWKIAIVAMFVFAGTYIGSATLAQFGLMFTGK